MACPPNNGSPYAAPASRRSSASSKDWMRTERARLSRHSEVAKAMDYMLKRWDSFTRFLADGRICSPTMPPSENCAASRSGASPGCSPAPTAAVSGRP
jgi:Transposase IS66 family